MRCKEIGKFSTMVVSQASWFFGCIEIIITPFKWHWKYQPHATATPTNVTFWEPLIWKLDIVKPNPNCLIGVYMNLNTHNNNDRCGTKNIVKNITEVLVEILVNRRKIWPPTINTLTALNQPSGACLREGGGVPSSGTPQISAILRIIWFVMFFSCIFQMYEHPIY